MNAQEVFVLLATLPVDERTAYFNKLDEERVEQLFLVASRLFHPPPDLLKKERVLRQDQIERVFVMYHLMHCVECGGILNHGEPYPKAKIAERTKSWVVAQAIIDRKNVTQPENRKKLVSNGVDEISRSLRH